MHGTAASPAPGTQAHGGVLAVDAGVEHLRLREVGADGRILREEVLTNHGNLRHLFADRGLDARFGNGHGRRAIVTGKLAATAVEALGGGRRVLPAAALWMAAKRLIAQPEHAAVRTLALVDLSASGYLLVGIDREGRLAHDLLVVNPRCGAGSGINLDRVLQKLAVAREAVDDLLASYLGESGRTKRLAIGTRADRCGVFASSATVSDKNQGIPLDVALATTLKSEVLKTCRKLPAGFDMVCFSGRIFRWQFARDCAEDFARELGVRSVVYDTENTHVLDALAALAPADPVPDVQTSVDVSSSSGQMHVYPSFGELKRQYESDGLYLRLPSDEVPQPDRDVIANRTVIVGLDVGSTMAKMTVADAADGTLLALSAYSNAGDTIETVKCALGDLQACGIDTVRVRGIGVTGSARYQVQQALVRIYPEAADRVSVLVENYAHARGSIALARQHVADLYEKGVPVNRELAILVDIGGEDTKISTIALDRAELFANAMNLKCSAGTGSLMDTLAALFGISSVADACAQAYAAPQSRAINATCAVFLMENARKLQAEGVPRNEILAAANWAIVENMARTLWHQVDLPKNAVVLLHGQTMLSEPLPLAVTDRLQSFLGAPAWALVPPHPGHRACIGLVRTMMQAAPPGETDLRLADFVDARFDKRIIECRGAVCGDAEARCNRTSLSCSGRDGGRFLFTLGGCTAINELFGRKGQPREAPPRDAYREVWDLVASRQPKSDAPNRLVLARSFCVSEWAYLFARVFEGFGIPVHVDEVREADLINAQGLFNIDTCAPHMGAVGQYRRLAAEPHGVILVPQIEDLPTGGLSRGHTCTLNQGGVAVAQNLASLASPGARFHPFSVRLSTLEADAICDQIETTFSPVFAQYGLAPTSAELRAAFAAAIDDHRALRREAADLAADLAEAAIAEGRQVAVVVGREYILNPGLYDSSVRRLLRDKRMTAIPSWVLDVELDPEFSSLYWRNPHAIVTILKAIADKTLHTRLRHPRLAAVFRGIEDRDPPGPLLPVVQVSTFSCGPDSVTAHLVADIMRQRPFLLLQSDAILKELAHLENRVNTYVKQLELGLHSELRLDDGTRFQIRRLHELTNDEPLDRARDVIYFPTMGDNRPVTSVLRAAGYACIDNWDESYDLAAVVREGRRFAGDAVCAPLAAVYGDLIGAVEDFTARRRRGDPLVAGKERLLFFDNQGDGPCRQGQYAMVHALLARGSFAGRRTNGGSSGKAGPAGSTGNGHDNGHRLPELPAETMLRLLVGHEDRDFDIGLDEWAMHRAYQSVIVHALLQDLHFVGGTRCRDREEYERFLDAHRRLKQQVHAAFESFHGPGPIARSALAVAGTNDRLGTTLKYFAYRMDGRDVTPLLRRFSRQWIRGRTLKPGHLRIHVSGEVYMRIAQAAQVFETLLTLIGFRRFHLTVSPIWAYAEYMPEYRVESALDTIRSLEARQRRARTPAERQACAAALAVERGAIRAAQSMGATLRRRVARPLYEAAGVPLPDSPRHLLDTAKEILPTLRPAGELGLYIGEVLTELRAGVDIFLSIAPTGCMVTSMGEVMTPKLQEAGAGRIQSLFSADGDIDEELLSLSLLRALGPERFVEAQSAH